MTLALSFRAELRKWDGPFAAIVSPEEKKYSPFLIFGTF